MKVSIIIPVKNGEATLPFCLQVLSSEHEIIVVNDHSTDDSCRIARQYATKVIDLKDKTGAAAARNAGVAASSGELLVFIDSDIIVRPSRFQRALSNFERKTIVRLSLDTVIAPLRESQDFIIHICSINTGATSAMYSAQASQLYLKKSGSPLKKRLTVLKMLTSVRNFVSAAPGSMF